MKTLEDYVWVAPAYSYSFCDKVINSSNNNSWDNHFWINRDKKESFSYPEKELKIQNLNNELKEEFFIETEKQIKQYVNKINKPEFKIISKLSNPRINKYEPNTLMRPHIDHISYIFDGNEKGIPCLSFVGVLNDDYEGGNFVLNDKEYNLHKGDLIIFPSNFMYPHYVKEVTKGTRYSIVCWGY